MSLRCDLWVRSRSPEDVVNEEVAEREGKDAKGEAKREGREGKGGKDANDGERKGSPLGVRTRGRRERRVVGREEIGLGLEREWFGKDEE